MWTDDRLRNEGNSFPTVDFRPELYNLSKKHKSNVYISQFFLFSL
jgi:hypothetical protein